VIRSPALALGTVQFGLAYGIAGRGEPVPEAETRAILRRAWDLGIHRLDTAPGYGAIEERLIDLIQDLPFSIASKVGAVPFPDEAAATNYVRSSVRQSRRRLGQRLNTILFHNAEDLSGENGRALWSAATDTAEGASLGPSCYDVETLHAIALSLPQVVAAQLPGNAFDQAVASDPPPAKMEISLRSTFLQGLLLMPEREAAARVPAARDALARWHGFCAEAGLSALEAALSVAKGLPGIDFCLVGVDNQAQLEEIAGAWERAAPLEVRWLDTPERDIIDPRRWSGSNE